jgi:hypothetical protein
VPWLIGFQVQSATQVRISLAALTQPLPPPPPNHQPLVPDDIQWDIMSQPDEDEDDGDDDDARTMNRQTRILNWLGGVNPRDLESMTVFSGEKSFQ